MPLGLFRMKILKFLFSVIFILAAAAEVSEVYPQQKIKDFYLSNFKEDGSRDWEVEGEEAFIYEEYVDINKMDANYFLKEDTIHITSDAARMDKTTMDAQLKDNVKIQNKDGTTLLTDSLNWQSKSNLIETDDWIKTTRDSQQITAKGLTADTQLKKADFKKDVELVLLDEETKEITTITCSGPLEIEYSLGKAVFHDNVIAVNPSGKLFSDKATLFFDSVNKKIQKIISEGNVKIIRQNNITFAEKATYFAAEQRIILEGRPRLIYFPDESKEGQEKTSLF